MYKKDTTFWRNKKINTHTHNEKQTVNGAGYETVKKEASITSV